MKHFIILAALAFISSAAKAGGNWVGLYTLDDGASASHTVAVVQVQRKNFYKNGKTIFLPKGTNMSGLIIKQDVLLSVDMNQIQFRKEVSKLGNIINSLVYPK